MHAIWSSGFSPETITLSDTFEKSGERLKNVASSLEKKLLSSLVSSENIGPINNFIPSSRPSFAALTAPEGSPFVS